MKSYLFVVWALAISVASGCGGMPTGTDMADDGPGQPFPEPGDTSLDSDGDGWPDDIEINGTPGTDPFDASDNPNNVRDSDGDGCSDYDELNFSGFCDNNPNTPGGGTFDGFWVAEGTLESGPLVGTTRLLIESSAGRVSCVSRAISDECLDLNYGTPSASRPITGVNDTILMKFTMDFPVCELQICSCFVENESFIEVTIAGFKIAGTDVFDVVIEERYLFSNVTLLSSGTLELISSTTLNRCGLP